MNRFWKTWNLASAAEAALGSGEIAGLKPCAAQNLGRGQGQVDRGVSFPPFFRKGREKRMGHPATSGRDDTAIGMAKGFLGRLWRECGAAEVAEAAFVLPLLFVFILGIFQFGRVYLVYSTLQHAALEGARAASASQCATCGGVPLTGAQVATGVVAPIFQNAHIDSTLLTAPVAPVRNSCVPPLPGVAVVCELSGTLASPKICVQRNVILNAPAGGNPTSGSPVCGTSVRLVYPYSFSLPSVSTTAPYISQQPYVLNLKAQAQVKGED